MSNYLKIARSVTKNGTENIEGSSEISEISEIRVPDPTLRESGEIQKLVSSGVEASIARAEVTGGSCPIGQRPTSHPPPRDSNERAQAERLIRRAVDLGADEEEARREVLGTASTEEEGEM